MEIIFSPTQLSACILSIQHLDLDNFEDQFKPIMLENKRIKGQPIFLLFNAKSHDRISELSMLVDSLKDLGLLIAGVVSEDTSVRKFAAFLALPSFKSVDSIVIPTEAIKHQDLSSQSDFKKSSENIAGTNANLRVPISSDNRNTGSRTLKQDSVAIEQSSPESSLTTRANNRAQEFKKNQLNEYNYQKEASKLYDPVNDEKINNDVQAEKIRYNQNHPLRKRFETDVSQQLNSNLDVSGIKVPKIPRASSVQISSLDKSATSFQQTQARQKQPPLIVRETIKSGQVVKHDGDLVLLKNSEKGSVINATGSIYCYAEARGILLAGSKGDTSARVFHAGDLQCEAIALSGLYVKYEQFAEVLKGQKMIMATKNKYEDKIDFNRLNEMPSLNNIGQEPIRKKATSNLNIKNSTKYVERQESKGEEIMQPLSS